MQLMPPDGLPPASGWPASGFRLACLRLQDGLRPASGWPASGLKMACHQLAVVWAALLCRLLLSAESAAILGAICGSVHQSAQITAAEILPQKLPGHQFWFCIWPERCMSL